MTRSWPSENIITGQTKRAVGVAMQITIGGLGAITGVLIYPRAFPAHNFRRPYRCYRLFCLRYCRSTGSIMCDNHVYCTKD